MIKKVLPYIVYPLTIALCLLLFFVLKEISPSLLLSTYLPLLLGATLITFYEFYIPNRKDWKGNKSDVKNDLAFLITVQMILPKILTFAIAYGMLEVFQLIEIDLTSIWPSTLPIGVQALIMILLADFFRYWFHVLSHNNEFFWKLHAVHHSPKKLYWLNVGRFHPVEKSMQFLLDALPFILLGINAEVLALYFVFYGVNGFFQHSNIKLNLGLLNYVISGPELHRWHHSKNPKESNSNYGNNIILWDLIFGTYYLPKNRKVEVLGLINKDYPLSYIKQLFTPFSGNIDKKSLPVQNMKGSILNFLLAMKMKGIARKLYNPLVNSTRSPKDTQHKLMLEILKTNENTFYGKKYSFSSIKDYDSFKSNLPYTEYEDFRQLIEEQDETKKAILTQENPFMFNQTSGTTGKPKFIPVLKSSLEAHRKTQQVFSFIQYDYCPEAFHGKLLGIVSPAQEGILSTGTPYGSASGHIYKTMPGIAKKKYVLPDEVFEINDYAIKYYIIARLSVEEPDITYIGTANPSTLHKLHEVINSSLNDIAKDIHTGTCQHLDQLDPRLSNAIKRRLKPNPKRSTYIRTQYQERNQLDFKEIWPFIKLIATWTGGSCGISLQSILPKFSSDTRVVELGYLASELRGTITVNPETNEGLPTLSTNFFEFVQKDKWENKEEAFQTLDSLTLNEEYYIFITTTTGLYRYHMNDILKVTGLFGNTPTLQFVQKGKGITNITGEKLYEGQIITAMSIVQEKLKLDTRFYLVLANENDSCYDFYYESGTTDVINTGLISDTLEAELMLLNMEYETKRSSDRLKQLNVIQLKTGTFEKYKEHQLKKGVREAQFKITLLQYSRELDFNLSTHEN